MLEAKKSTAGIAKYYYYNVYADDASEEDYKKTYSTIEYLKECGFSFLTIFKEIILKSNTRAITIDNVPNKFWKDSLVKKDAYYLHDELRLVSKAPEFNPITGETKRFPFYCEMKIKYGIEDVLNYFYTHIGKMNAMLADKKSDTKAVIYLMKKYEKIDYVEPLDIILCLIDNSVKNSDRDITKLIQITDNSLDVIIELQNNMQELSAKDRKRTVWRWENV